MADQVLVEFRAGFDGLKADANAIKTEFKSVEDAGVKAGEKTSNSFDKATESTKSLKTQLKELKAQIATSTDPKEIEKLSKAAGELSDKINDANESVKVFASGSKFQQIGNALGTIVSNVRSLDFQRANEQSKVLANITKSLTFKEAVVGVKELGGTLLNLGKSLLLNPLFIIPALIGLIIENFDKLKAAGGLTGETFKAIGKIVEVVTAGFKGFLENMGLINTQAMEIYEQQKENLENLTNIHKKQSDRIIQILQSQGRDTFRLQQQAIDKELQLNEEKYKALRQAIIDGVVDEEEGAKQIKELGEKKADIITQLSTLYYAENKKRLDNEKATNKQIADEAAALNKVLRDLRTGNISNDYDRERQALEDKLADDIEKYKTNGAIIAELRIKAVNELDAINQKQRLDEQKIDQDKLKATQAGIDARTKAEEDFDEETRQRNINQLNDYVESLNKGDEAAKESAKKRQEAQKQLESEIVKTLDALNEYSRSQTDNQISEVEDRKNYELDSLEDQYKQQLITKDAYEKKKSEIQKKAQAEESALKRKQFENDKQLSLIRSIISGAEGVVNALKVDPPLGFVLAGLVAAQTALQIAVISNQQPPKFEKGGKVKGRRHINGGTLIEAEEDEHVTRRDQAIKYDRMLRAINDDQAESFIKVHYIAPAIREYQKKNENIVINNKTQPTNYKNLIDSMKETRKQSREDFNMLAKVIASNSRSSHKW